MIKKSLFRTIKGLLAAGAVAMAISMGTGITDKVPVLANFSTTVYAAETDTVYNGVDYSAVYNADYYYNHNDDVAAAFGYDPDALIAHFVNYGMSEGRCASENFNVVCYCYDLSNQDLKDAFGGDMTAYYMHYIDFGKAEGRSTDDWQDVFDPQYYINSNPDVKDYIVSRYSSSGNQDGWALWHFVEYGANEGRSGSPYFNLSYYMQNNQDLMNAYGANSLSSYYKHYIVWGKNEGRKGYSSDAILTVYNGVDYSAVYNKDYYLAHNEDIKNAFNGDPYLTLQHFVVYGMGEGRQAIDGFNVNTYKNNYADLRSAYGNDIAAYYMHYIKFGKTEGRNAVTVIPNTDIDKKTDEVNLADFKYTTNSDWSYGTDNGHSIYILGYKGTSANPTIPSQIDGRDVTFVKISNSSIVNLKLPDTVKKSWLELANVETINLGKGMDTLYMDTIRSAPKLKELTVGGHITNIEDQWAGTDDTYLPFFQNAVLNINSEPEDILIAGEDRLVDNANGDIFGIINDLAGLSKQPYFSTINFKTKSYSK